MAKIKKYNERNEQVLIASTIRVPPDYLDSLDKIAKRMKMSRSALLRKLILEFIVGN